MRIYIHGSRLTRRERFANVLKVENDENVVQLLTDCMANALPIQMEYADTGWRTVTPYGWHASQSGNLLVMCYKDGMNIRSYRLDRIVQLYVDESLFINDVPVIDLELKQMLEEDTNIEAHADPDDFNIPDLPDEDKLLELSETEEGDVEGPYDDALDTLDNYDNVPDFTAPPADEQFDQMSMEVNDNAEQDLENLDDTGALDDGGEPADDADVPSLWLGETDVDGGGQDTGVDEPGDQLAG